MGPNDVELRLRQLLMQQKSVAAEFAAVAEKNILRARTSERDADRALFIAKLRFGRRMHAFEVPQTERLRFQDFIHTSNCPAQDQTSYFLGSERRPPPKFLKSRAVKKLASEIVGSSPHIAQAVRSYGGHWWTHVKWEPTDGEALGRADMPWGAVALQAHFSDFVRRVQRIARNPFLQVRLSNYQTTRALSSGTLARELTFARHQAVFVATLQAITDTQSRCFHPGSVECLVCGELGRVDLRLVAEFGLHPSTCDWCATLITTREKPSIFYRGVSDETQRELFELAFSELDRLTDFPYWRSPFLDSKMMKRLRIGSLPASVSRTMSIVLACLARKEVVGRLYENPEAIISGAGLSNQFPRGKGRGVRSIASDGHLCLSFGERDICEFLHQKGVEHSREPQYAKFSVMPEIFGATRGDFLVGGVIYEFAGLAGNAAYDEKLALKVRRATEQGIAVTVITPDQLDKLERVFAGHLGPSSPLDTEPRVDKN
jgi:hypothetical protein